jgi:calcium-translocating P-type ATPase
MNPTMSAPAKVGATEGLSSAEAAERLTVYGRNLLPPPPSRPVFVQVAGQLFHFFGVMLWIAGVLAIVARMPQLGYAIFAVIVLNGAFAFIQEYRAERAAARLRDLLPRRATVRRDGMPMEIDAADLVPGDVVVLSSGDRISADIVLSEAYSLQLDTSALTGESVATLPGAGEMVFAGTFVLEGEAVGVVAATGKQTRLAAIAQMTEATRRPPSPLELELDRVVRVIALVSLGAGLFFLLVAILAGIGWRNGFLFGIGVTVALVPEGLLPTVTLTLAVGARRMAARNALVRRLESVETLGSTTFICTDKTGTLTLNQMSVVAAWTPSGRARIMGEGYAPSGKVEAEEHVLEALRRLAWAAGRCSNGRAISKDGVWVAQGDPMDVSIRVLAARVGIDLEEDERARPVAGRFAFDPRKKRVSVVIGEKWIAKGAPELLLEECRAGTDATDALDEMTRQGLRVLAVASGRAKRGVTPAREADSDLELLGLLGIEDPPRPGVARAIAKCREAGIRVAMVTGDHPRTAAAIAREIGLQGPDGSVIEGKNLPADEEVLGALVDRDGIVLSRVSPEDKLRIARALRGRGHVVAMTGDGVNDAAALHEAAIGIAMGRSGTDVAREASDLVLLDDNFETIVAAVEQGRATFANTRRFLTYHLTDNVAELAPFLVWALSGARFPLALGVLQILCIDLGTDVLPAVALGAEPPSPRVLRRPPYGRHLIDRGLLARALGILGPVEAFVALAAFVVSLVVEGWRPGLRSPTGAALAAASGAAFTAVVIGQMANAFACRSATQWAGGIPWRRNIWLSFAVLSELLLLVGFLYFPPIASLLSHAPPTGAGYATAVAAGPAVLLADWLHKRRKGVW